MEPSRGTRSGSLTVQNTLDEANGMFDECEKLLVASIIEISNTTRNCAPNLTFTFTTGLRRHLKRRMVPFNDDFPHMIRSIIIMPFVGPGNDAFVVSVSKHSKRRIARTTPTPRQHSPNLWSYLFTVLPLKTVTWLCCNGRWTKWVALCPMMIFSLACGSKVPCTVYPCL